MDGVEMMIQSLWEGVERGEYPSDCVEKYLRVVGSRGKGISKVILNLAFKTRNPRPINALSETETMILEVISSHSRAINTKVLEQKLRDKDFKGTTGSIQCRVSQLKKRGFVFSQKRGQYEITGKGAKAIATKEAA